MGFFILPFPRRRLPSIAVLPHACAFIYSSLLLLLTCFPREVTICHRMLRIVRVSVFSLDKPTLSIVQPALKELLLSLRYLRKYAIAMPRRDCIADHLCFFPPASVNPEAPARPPARPAHAHSSQSNLSTLQELFPNVRMNFALNCITRLFFFCALTRVTYTLVTTAATRSDFSCARVCRR